MKTIKHKRYEINEVQKDYPGDNDRFTTKMEQFGWDLAKNGLAVVQCCRGGERGFNQLMRWGMGEGVEQLGLWCIYVGTANKALKF